MASHRITPPWHYLHEASNPSLESFELSRLNHAANIRKEIAALIEQWIEETAEALLARWMREDRKMPQEPEHAVELPAQAELPLAPPQTIAAAPREPIRRLRSRRAEPRS